FTKRASEAAEAVCLWATFASSTAGLDFPCSSNRSTSSAHKHTASAASEALLVKAYAARIRALVQAGLNEEAKALLALVGQRYSRFKEALAGIGFILHAGTSLDDFL